MKDKREQIWREEFSVDAPEDAYVLRRQFTKFLVLTSAGMACGNGWIWLRSLAAGARPEYPERIVARRSELAAGAVRTFSYPGPQDPCILFRRPDGSIAAFSQKCTHLSCAVNYSAARDRLECPCHEGRFDLRTGVPIAGPPKRPLTRIVLERRGGEIFAVGIEERTT